MNIKDELTEIRTELLTGVENSDMLYIKMMINKIDTVIYNLNVETVKRSELIDLLNFRDKIFYSENEFTENDEIVDHYLKSINE